MGSGTLLASVSVPHGTAERIEDWFRRHPRFRDNAPASAEQMAALPAVDPAENGDGLLIADELRKLAALRDEGILSDAEFAARKQWLLARGT